MTRPKLLPLLPCPFCGGEAVVMHMNYGHGYLSEVQTVWGVWCRNDLKAEYQHGHYIDNYATEREAVSAWNTRWQRPHPNQLREVLD